MNCPKCKSGLDTMDVGILELERCESCSGVWFDLGEYEDFLAGEKVKMLKARVDAAAAGDAVTEAPCPSCGGSGRMVPVHDTEHNVTVDTCPVCYGHWLDGAQLAHLQATGNLGDVVAKWFA